MLINSLATTLIYRLEMGSWEKEIKKALSAAAEPVDPTGTIQASQWISLEYLNRTTTLFQGLAGAGKSVLVSKLCSFWARGELFKNAKMVILINFRESAFLKASSLKAVLKQFYKSLKMDSSEEAVSWLETFVTTHTESVLWIFDGVERLFSKRSNGKEHLYAYDLLAKCAREKLPLLIVGRPGAMDHTPLSKIEIQQSFEIAGFVEQADMKNYLSSNLNPRILRNVNEYMVQNEWLCELCMLPRMATELITILHKDPFFLTKSGTSILHALLLKFIKTECSEHVSLVSVFQLPPTLLLVLRHISLIAYHCTKFGDGLGDYELSLVNLSGGVASLAELGGLGLLYHTSNKVLFLTRAVKHFLCALHISFLPISEQVGFYYENSSALLTFLSPVAIYHFGLSRLSQKSWFDSSKLALSSALDCLARSNSDSPKVLLILCLIYESREESLVRKVTTHFTEFLTVNLSVGLSDNEKNALLFMVGHSGIKKWRIQIKHGSDKSTAESLVFFFATSLSEDIEVAVVETEDEVFSLEPAPSAVFTAKSDGSALNFEKYGTSDYEKQELFKHAIQCNAHREALHRVFNLYSKVKLRSDAGDPTYLSFLTCRCIEDNLRKDVIIYPIHPVHSIKLAANSKKTKRIGTEREAAKKHIEEVHDKCYTELIVLSCPYPKCLVFQPPGSSESCELVLSAEKLPSNMSGRIAVECRASIMEESSLVICQCESQQREKNLEMVTHGLPLPPSKSKLEATKATIIQEEHKLPVNMARVSGGEGPDTAAQVAPSHLDFYKNSHSEDLVTPVQAATSERVTWRPGMIVFTVSITLSEVISANSCCLGNQKDVTYVLWRVTTLIEHFSVRLLKVHLFLPLQALLEVFQKHKTYPTPSEEHMIRRGGNGQIFAVDYSGYTLAAKKTHFRSREYNIITQLKHPNIIPLMAVMVGEISHKRKFFCYHILPRMSGESSRKSF